MTAASYSGVFLSLSLSLILSLSLSLSCANKQKYAEDSYQDLKEKYKEMKLHLKEDLKSRLLGRIWRLINKCNSEPHVPKSRHNIVIREWPALAL